MNWLGNIFFLAMQASILAFVAFAACEAARAPDTAAQPAVDNRVNLARVCNPDASLRACVDLLVKLGVHQVEIGGGFPEKADAQGK